MLEAHSRLSSIRWNEMELMLQVNNFWSEHWPERLMLFLFLRLSDQLIIYSIFYFLFSYSQYQNMFLICLFMQDNVPLFFNVTQQE